MKLSHISIAFAVLATSAFAATTDHALSDQLAAEAAALAPAFVPAAAPATDPVGSGTWSAVIPWTPHIPVTAAQLPDGRLLTFSSNQRTTFPSGPEFTYAAVWNPATGQFTEINNTRHDMFCGGVSMLPDGRVVVNGGRNTTVLSSIFDYRTNQWTAIPNMNDPRWYNTSVALTDGSVFTVSGSGGSNTAERWSAASGWQRLTGINWSTVTSRAGYITIWHPFVLLAPNGQLFHFGPTRSMDWVNPNGSGSVTASGLNVPGTHYPKEGCWAMYDEGKIVVAGGGANTTPNPSDSTTGTSTNIAYTVNLNGATPVVQTAASMQFARQFANSVILPSGEVMVIGGNTGLKFNDTGSVLTPEVWNPRTGTWRTLANHSVPRNYHSLALLLPDGRVWSGGGGLGGNAADHRDAQIFTPPALYNANGTLATRPVITQAPTQVGPGVRFTVNATAGLSKFAFIKMSSQTHSVNTDLRYIELPFSEVAAGNYELTSHANLNVMTPGFWMLFALDSKSVHSVSKIIQVTATPINLANPGNQTSVVGELVSLQIQVAGSGGLPPSYSATGLPAGLSIGSTSGVISGAPTTSGTYNVIISGGGTQVTFQWTINSALTLSPIQGAPVARGSSTALTVQSIGGKNPRYVWSFGDGTANSASSSSPGVTHTFTQAGRYLVTVTATDVTGRIVTASFYQGVFAPLTARKPNASSSIAYEARTPANSRVWVANPDADTVTVFDAVTRAKLAETTVGVSPRCVAIAPDGRVWVTAADSSVISILNSTTYAVAQTISLPRGSRPFGLAFEPVGTAAWVALEGTGRVLKLNPSTGAQIADIAAGSDVRHLSVSADGAKVLASRFITPRLPGEETAVVDTTGKGGEVLVIDAATTAVTRTIILQHSEEPDTTISGRGIPNYLGAPVISPDGLSAWVPSKQDNIKRGVLRNGQGLTHESAVRPIASRIDLVTQTEDYLSRVDFDNAGLPSAVCYDPSGIYAFVALEGSRTVAVMDVWNAVEITRFAAGRAPQGLAISPDGRTLFVQNFMDRTVSVHDVSAIVNGGVLPATTAATLNSVTTEKLTAQVLTGKQLFYDANDNRLALQEYLSCAGCHNDAGQDGRVWDFTGFGEGLRNTITLRGHGTHGALHWTGNFDEFQDFEGQIRSFAGGLGLIAGGTPNPTLGAPNAGRSADLDALAAYLASLNKSGASPARADAATLPAAAIAGRTIFKQQNCASCHGGVNFSNSALGVFRDIGTLKPSSGQRLGGALTGLDVPTLRGLWATAPYLHDGAAATLGAAVRAHNGVTLSDADLGNLVAYLNNLDDSIVSAPVSLGVTLSAPASASAAFSVTASFSSAATGFALGDIAVTNGVASNLQGSGANYTYTVTPTAVGNVVISVGANLASDADGDGNLASNTLTVNYTTSGPTVLLADDFNDNTRDAAKWNVGTIFAQIEAGAAGFDSAIPVVERNQRVEVQPRANVAGDHYAGYVTTAAFDFTDATASVRVQQTANGDADTYFAVAKDPQNFLLMVVEGGALYLDQAVAGSRQISVHNYNATQQQYWRIRHTSGSPARIAFETSADGTTWQTLRTDNTRFVMTATKVEFGAGTWTPVATPGTAIFDLFQLVRTAVTPPANLPPVARPGGPYAATRGVALTLNGSASTDADGTISNYAWNFGDGTTGSGVSPGKTYAAAGTFTVSLTVTDNAGSTNTATTTAVITAPANVPPVARPGGPYAGTTGVAVAFNGSTSTDADGTIASYAWNFGDGTTATGPTPTKTYSTAGTFTVALTVTDNSGATNTANTTATITSTPVNQPPVARPGGPYSATVGTALTLNGSASSDPDGSIASYEWRMGDTTRMTTVLSDDFADNARDAAKWSVGTVFGIIYAGAAGYDPGITVAERNQRIEIVLRSGVSNDRFAGYVTANTFDFTGGAVSAEVVQAGAGQSNTLLAVCQSSSNSAIMVEEAGVLYCCQFVGAAISYQAVTYSPTQQRFWRIRHVPGATPLWAYEASADGATWQPLHSTAVQFPVTAVRAEITAGTWQPETAPGTAIFDNFKFTRTSTVAETVLTGSSPSITYTVPGAYTVRLKVTDNGGAINEATTTVNVASGGPQALNVIVAAPKANGGTNNNTASAPAFLLQHEDTATAGTTGPLAFTELRGKWIGIASANTLADTARINLSLGKTGSLTGKLTLPNSVIPLSGRISRDGTAAIKIPRKGAEPLRVQLAFDPVTHVLRGALHSDALIVEIIGHHALFDTAKTPLPTEWSGHHVTALATSVGRASLRANVAADGSVRINGKLPGIKIPFIAGTLLSRDGRLPVFTHVPGTKEILSGWLQFSTTGEIRADLGWFRDQTVEALGTPGVE